MAVTVERVLREPLPRDVGEELEESRPRVLEVPLLLQADVPLPVGPLDTEGRVGGLRDEGSFPVPTPSSSATSRAGP